jgi:hypothetical protein
VLGHIFLVRRQASYVPLSAAQAAEAACLHNMEANTFQLGDGGADG